MKLDFVKMHGSGNDFILIDNVDGKLALTLQQIRELCSRHTGIGSDGLMLIEKHDETDFYVQFYNPDASQSFCGNGSRCAVAFASELGLWNDQTIFEAIDGRHTATLKSNGNVCISMGKVSTYSKEGKDLFFHTGSPHLIRKVAKVSQVDVQAEGSAIRYSPRWKADGVNVNFVQELGEDSIAMRTYERGVEAETLSCGTGVTAAALAHALAHKAIAEVSVSTQGGNLEVAFSRKNDGFENIFLTGPTQKVFNGTIDL